MMMMMIIIIIIIIIIIDLYRAKKIIKYSQPLYNVRLRLR